MRTKLAYGKQGLMLDLPDDWNVTVIEPRYVPGLPDPAGAMRTALQNPISTRPLAEIVQPGDRVGIVFSDITRATPHGLILPAVLAELRHVPKEQIMLCCALGTHRPNTTDELRSMFAMAGTPEMAEELLSTSCTMRLQVSQLRPITDWSLISRRDMRKNGLNTIGASKVPIVTIVPRMRTMSKALSIAAWLAAISITKSAPLLRV